MNEENSGHSKFQANAAHLWTPVPLHLNLRRWSGKKLVLKFGWHIAQGRILDPKFSCADACSGSRDCPFTKGSDSHYTDIWASFNLLVKFEEKCVWYQAPVSHKCPHTLHVLRNNTHVRGRKGVPLSYMQGHKVGLRYRRESSLNHFWRLLVLFGHQDGKVHLLKFCQFWKPLKEGSITVHRKQLPSLTSVQSDTFPWRTRDVIVTPHTSSWE